MTDWCRTVALIALACTSAAASECVETVTEERLLEGDERERQLEALLRAYSSIENFEFLCCYPTGGKGESGADDFLYSRCKLLDTDLFWVEGFHSDSLGANDRDTERTVIVRRGEEVTQFWPFYRAVRRSTQGESCFNPPEAYLQALGWWPAGSEKPGPLLGDVPCSIIQLLSEAEGWRAIETAGGESIRLESIENSASVTFERAKGWAIAMREFGTDTVVARIRVGSFRALGDRFVPEAIVTEHFQPGDQGVQRYECHLRDISINECDESSLELEQIPGLFNLGADSDTRHSDRNGDDFRQVEAGGLDLLYIQADLLRKNSGRTMRPFAQLAALAFLAGFMAFGLCIAFARWASRS